MVLPKTTVVLFVNNKNLCKYLHGTVYSTCRLNMGMHRQGPDYLDLSVQKKWIDPFTPNTPFLYPLKTSEGRERVYWNQMS